MEENNSIFKISDQMGLEGDISSSSRDIIEMKIWSMLGKWTERYTMGDSTSVTIEIAEELLRSIMFSIDIEMKNSNNSLERLVNEDIMEILKSSWTKIELMIDEGKRLLQEVIATKTDIGNISYDDTINEIGNFFKRYDFRFMAHRINCSIDYQLSNPIDESLQGIEYINKYLETILFENRFLMRFTTDNIINVLNSFCSDYKGLLINIFEPVLTNTVGLAIIGEDVSSLNISELNAERILSYLRGLSENAIKYELKKAAEKVCKILNIRDNEEISYIEKTALGIYPRLKEAMASGNINNIFVSFKSNDIFTGEIFIGNEPMDDEKLREIIDEIKSCRYISDKIIIVKEEVHSLEDLIEILGQCFYGDEALELLKTFSKEEIEAVKNFFKYREDYSSDSQWENIFKKSIL